MFIRVGFDIAYFFPQPTELIMMLYTHPSRSSFLMKPERLTSDPPMIIEDFIGRRYPELQDLPRRTLILKDFVHRVPMTTIRRRRRSTAFSAE